MWRHPTTRVKPLAPHASVLTKLSITALHQVTTEDDTTIAHVAYKPSSTRNIRRLTARDQGLFADALQAPFAPVRTTILEERASAKSLQRSNSRVRSGRLTSAESETQPAAPALEPKRRVAKNGSIKVLPLSHTMTVRKISSQEPSSTAASPTSLTRKHSWPHRLQQSLHRLVMAWEQVQVYNLGMYSIERLQALQEFQESESFVQGLSRAFLTPAPALLVVLLLDAIPLQPREAGWRANGTFWVRLAITYLFITFGIILQAQLMIPDLNLTPRQMIVISISTAVANTLLLLAFCAGLDVFPIPFSLVATIVPYIGLVSLVFLIVVGRSPFLRIADLRLRVWQHSRIVIAQSVLTLVYPAYNAVFATLKPTQQSGLVLLLPLVKIFMKYVVARASSHLEDHLPEISIFSVEVFHSLYQVRCMQSAGSISTTAAIMAIDVAETFWSLLELYQETNIVLDLQKRHHVKIQRRELMHFVLEMCKHPEALDRSMLSQIRMRACVRHPLSSTGAALLHHLQSYGSALSRSRKSSAISSRSVRLRSRILSLKLGSSKPPRFSPSESEKRVVVFSSTFTAKEKTKLIQRTLRVLFHCEYLALVEYVECAIPLLYAIYLFALYVLPARVHYDSLRELDASDLRLSVVTILAFGALEWVSFVFLHYVLKWYLNVSPFYQLVFVLKHQMGQIQGRLLVWVVYIMPFPLLHYGIDFTFKFAWLRAAPTNATA